MKYMNKILGLALALPVLLATLGGLPTDAKADEAMEKMINARQGYYQNVRHNAGILFGMAKGEVEYDAAMASTAANNLLLLSQMDTGSYWAAGSSKEEMPGKTRALKKIWDTYPAVGEKGKAFKEAVAAMAAAAGNGVDGIRANAGALGGSCKGCHDEFRAKEF